MGKFEEELEKNGNLIYHIQGDSMMPLIDQSRDLVIIEKPKRPCGKYDVVLYRRDNGRYILHRILKRRKQDFVICGDNRKNREYGITDDHVIGLMTGILRNGKELPLNTWKYKVYVHYCCDFFYLKAGVLCFKKVLRKLRGQK